ncbi:MAG: cytochrome c-type protein NapB [Sulfurimonas sp.]|jgi:cytochrome c-type protein NapB
MKTISKITIGLAAAALLVVGCGESTKVAPTKKSEMLKTVSEKSLGLRKTDLYSENTDTVGDATKYSTSVTGSGTTIKRAFQDAPPMIPHDVEGMLPITINDNQCIVCHEPMAAKEMGMGTIPYPASHMTDFRPTTTIAEDGKISKNGTEIDNTSSEKLKNVSIKKLDKLSGSRFNCTLCHAPQSGDAVAVKNTFEADFTSADGASKSSWTGTKLMEGIDTTK